MEAVVAYKCEHCRKISENKACIKHHEKKCYYNPVSRSCATCKHLIYGFIENPKKPGYFNKDFQSCKLGLDVKLKHLKTKCDSHEVRPEYDDEIEYIEIFQGPYWIRAGQSDNILSGRLAG